VLDWELKSLILILILVAAYLTFEIIIWVRTRKVMQCKAHTIALWLLAVAAIAAATIFWALSQTGGKLCDPKDFFQPHGLLWHPLAGVMAVLLYFYWREDEDAA
jgi:peptidoglycan/LPS O-acetylase OafA/YrhL